MVAEILGVSVLEIGPDILTIVGLGLVLAVRWSVR